MRARHAYEHDEFYPRGMGNSDPIAIPGGLLLLPYKFAIAHVSVDAGSFALVSHVVDVRNGKPIEVTFHDSCPDPWNVRDPAVYHQAVRECIARAVVHEVDEVLRHADSRHLNDPHSLPYTRLRIE